VARQGKQEFNADEGRCTQNTQMARRGLQEVGHTLDFQARFVEIKQRAELPACCYLRVLRASSSYICVKILPLRYCRRMVPESNQERAVRTSAQCGTGIIRPLHAIAMALICIRSFLAEASVKSAIYRRLNENSPHAAVVWQIGNTQLHREVLIALRAKSVDASAREAPLMSTL